MFVKELFLTNFRNYKEANFSFHEKINLILGDNARGKTNLLESIYLSSLGKSFRSVKDVEMIRFEAELCKVKVVAEREESEKKVEIIINKEEKTIKKDGLKIKKTSELVNHILIVVFSPEDLKIVKDNPEKRRSFMDRELCQIKPSYYANLVLYKRALSQRNACLRENEVNENMIGVWDDQLAAYGAKVIAEREKFVEKLNRISGEIHRNITDDKEKLEIFYEANVPFRGGTQEQVETLRSELEKSLVKDSARGATSVGPHRDDLRIDINDVDSKRFGSQGQQRSAALSMKLAELVLIEEETGEKAILLLDDVLSELDAGRQAFLIRSMRPAQLFITATDIGESVRKTLSDGDIFYMGEDGQKIEGLENSCRKSIFDVQ